MFLRHKSKDIILFFLQGEANHFLHRCMCLFLPQHKRRKMAQFFQLAIHVSPLNPKLEAFFYNFITLLNWQKIVNNTEPYFFWFCLLPIPLPVFQSNVSDIPRFFDYESYSLYQDIKPFKSGCLPLV